MGFRIGLIELIFEREQIAFEKLNTMKIYIVENTNNYYVFSIFFNVMFYSHFIFILL